MTPLSRNRLALLLVTPALALSACGGSSDSDKISDIIKNGDKDPTTICDNASAKLKALLGGDKCKDAARAYSNKSHVVGDIKVTVNGDKATATFKTSDGKTQHPSFIKEDGDWKVDSPS